MIACMLVACAQQDGEPSIKAIAGNSYELPDFALAPDSDYVGLMVRVVTASRRV